MTTPQQFMEAFLREKAAAAAESNVRFAAVNAKYFGEPLSKHSRDFLLREKPETVIDDVTLTEDSAVVITREPLTRDAVQRHRYHLSAFGGSWKITRLDRECLYCRGNRQSRRIVCQHCDGDGWYDPRKNAA
jgi:hypothetical protein